MVGSSNSNSSSSVESLEVKKNENNKEEEEIVDKFLRTNHIDKVEEEENES